MNDFTIVNLQDLATATGLTENDFLAIGQGDKALTKATIQQVGTFLGISSAVKIGDKNTAPTEPSFAFAEAGTYTNWGNVEITGNLGILIFDGTNFSKVEINFVANGVVEEGNEQAVSGGEVYNNIPKIKTLSLIDKNSPYIKYRTVIATGGNWATATTPTGYAGAVSIVDFPLEPNETYSLYGFEASSGKNFALSNGLDDVIQVSTLSSLPKIFTTTSTHYFLRAYIKQIDSQEPTSNWENTLMLVKGTVLPSADLVTEINGRKIEAVKLSENNQVPNPINNQNAVNKEHFDANAIKDSDLTLEYSDNKANPNKIIYGRYIGNTGSWAGTEVPPQDNVWKTIEIDVSELNENDPISFGNFIINTAGYSAFYNDSTLVLYNGSHAYNPINKVVLKPAGANKLFITFARPANNETDNNELTVNFSDTLQPYQPFAKLKGIKGLPIESTGGGGGVAYDQSLNTTDEVQFAKVTTSEIETSVLVLNLPTTEPSISNRAWIDVANGNVIKVTS